MLRGLTAFIRQLSLFEGPSPPAVPSPAGTAVPPPDGDRSSSAAFPTADPPRDSVPFAALCQGAYAHIRVETGKRLRDSWKVTWTRRQEALLLRVPPSLEDAPREIKEAALRWALLVAKRTRKPDPLVREERSRLETLIRDCLHADRDADRPGPQRSRRLAINRRRIARLNPKGACHDLGEILASINGAYFGGALEARITWASRLGGLSTHRMAEDGEGKPYHLLTISRGYDCPEATREAVGGVVYHECLHIVIPPRREGGRRVVHGKDFRARERQYAHFHAWRKWHREGLPKALRRMLRDRQLRRRTPVSSAAASDSLRLTTS